jgi:hypothetical protein
LVSSTSRKPSGGTSQKGCGSDRKVDGAHPDARVVDEQVDAPEALPNLRHTAGDGTFVAGIER